MPYFLDLLLRSNIPIIILGIFGLCIIYTIVRSRAFWSVKAFVKWTLIVFGAISLLAFVLPRLHVNNIISMKAYHFMNGHILKEYAAPNGEIKKLEEKIYDEYGIRVYSNIRPEEIYCISNIQTQTDSRESDIYDFLLRIYDALTLYNEESLRSIPKEIYLVSGIENKETELGGINVRYFIALDTKAAISGLLLIDHNIHHEFFHSLDIMMGIDNIRYFSENFKSCALVSDYSCEGIQEFVAESWALSFHNQVINEYTDHMKGLYPRYLNLSKEHFQEPTGEIGIKNYFYDQLSGTEKQIYRALLMIHEGKGLKYIVDGDQYDLDKIFEVIEATDPDLKWLRNSTLYSYEGDTYIFTSEDLYKKNRDEEFSILEVPDIENEKNEYEKLLKIYKRFLNTALSSNGSLKRDYDLPFFRRLKKEGYEVYRLGKELDRCFLIGFNGAYYWIDVMEAFKNSRNIPMVTFMIDDARLNKKIEYLTFNLPRCDDSSMSYMSQYELYLKESDEEKIEEYIGKKVKNGHEDAITLYIDCVNENVKNEVYQYLSSKNKRGESKVQELCDYYCRLFGYDYYLAAGIGTIENTIVIHAWS